MAEKLDELDNNDELIYVRFEDSYCGYKPWLLSEEIAPYLRPFILCACCEGVMRDPCGIGNPQVFVCSGCSREEEGNPLSTERDLVSALLGNCPLKERGCVWQGILTDLVVHLEKCLSYKVDCLNKCGCVVRREEMAHHLENECSTRKIRCEVCNEYYLFGDDNMHQLECWEALVGCPLECGGITIRKHLCEHMDELCPNTIVSCPFVLSGCCDGVEILRKDVEIHCRELKIEHLEMKTEFLLEENASLKAKSNFQQEIINNLVNFAADPACLYYFVCQSSFDSSQIWTLNGLSAIGSDWTKGPAFKFQYHNFRIQYKLENSSLVIGLSVTLQSANHLQIKFCTFFMRHGTKKPSSHYEYTAEYYPEKKNQSLSAVKGYFHGNKQIEKNVAIIPIALFRSKLVNVDDSVEFEIYYK